MDVTTKNCLNMPGAYTNHFSMIFGELGKWGKRRRDRECIFMRDIWEDYTLRMNF